MGRMYAGHYVTDDEFDAIQEALKSSPDIRDSSDAAQERAKVINQAEGIVPTEDKELEALAQARAAGFPSIEAQAEVGAIVENAPVSDPNVPTNESNAEVTAKTEAGKAEAEKATAGDEAQKAQADVKISKAKAAKGPQE